MDEPPRDPREPLLPWRLLTSITWRSLLIAGSTATAFVLAQVKTQEISKAVTIAFASIALGLLLHMFNSRSDRFLLTIRRRQPNPYIWLAFAGVLSLQLLGIYAPPLQLVLRTVPLNLADWSLVVTAALVPAILVELSKLLPR